MENVDARQISSHIWAMANELRGTMDAGEYKTFILSFMFYRSVSLQPVPERRAESSTHHMKSA